MLILKALSLGPMHGYGVGQRIMQLAEDLLRVEEDSLYPAHSIRRSTGWKNADGSNQNGAHRRIIAALVSIGSHVSAAINSRWKKRIGSDLCWLLVK
jgi:PadR family transcriptional regulator